VNAVPANGPAASTARAPKRSLRPAKPGASDLARVTRRSARSGLDQVEGTERNARPTQAQEKQTSQSKGRPEAPDVLAFRLAGRVADHEPGWHLPRFTVLARQFGVKPQQVAAAVDKLVAIDVVRRLPSGEFGRVSPAEYHIPLRARAEMSARIEPVGGPLACRSQTVSLYSVPDEVAYAIGPAAGEPGCLLKRQYAVADQPASVSTTYAAASATPVLQEIASAQHPALPPLMPSGNEARNRSSFACPALQLEMQQLSAGTSQHFAA